MFFGVLGTYLFYTDRLLLSGLAFSLCALSRPEGVLLVGLVGVLEFKKIFQPKFILPFVIPLVIWFTFAFFYFGNPLPHTLSVKVAQGGIITWADRRFFAPFIYLFYFFPYKIFWLGILMGLGAVLRYRENRWLFPFMFWGFVHGVAFFKILKVPNIYPWYYYALSFSYIFIMSIGLAIIIRWLITVSKIKEKINFQINKNINKIFSVPIILLLVLLTFFLQMGFIKHTDLKWYVEVTPPEYVFAKYAKEHLPPTTVLGSLDIGVLGYITDFPIQDFALLVQKERSEGRADLIVIRNAPPGYECPEGYQVYWTSPQTRFPGQMEVFIRDDFPISPK